MMSTGNELGDWMLLLPSTTYAHTYGSEAGYEGELAKVAITETLLLKVQLSQPSYAFSVYLVYYGHV